MGTNSEFGGVHVPGVGGGKDLEMGSLKKREDLSEVILV